jgi:hypothetical protein
MYNLENSNRLEWTNSLEMSVVGLGTSLQSDRNL